MRLIQRGLLSVLALLAGSMASADPALHLAGGAGISYGGDTLATVTYSNGDSSDVKAGGLFYINAGPSIEFTGSPISLQVLLGYQVDNSTAQNGEVKFDRTTLDTTLFYQTGNHRIGAGIVNHFSPSYHQSSFYSSDNGAYSPGIDGKFADANGVSVEYQYRQAHSHVGLSLRYVSINYKLNSSTVDGIPFTPTKTDFDGSFLAAGFYLYF